MILIEDAREIPEFMLTNVSKFERVAVPETHWRPLLNQSYDVKIVLEDDRTLLIAGLWRGSFLGQPHFWALIGEAFASARPSSLRNLRRYAETFPSGVQTYINVGQPNTLRLAEFFGFRPLAKQFTFEDQTYEVYGRPV